MNPADPHFFDARLGTAQRVTTFVLGYGLCLGMPIGVSLFIWHQTGQALAFFPAAAGCALFAWLFLFAPRGYRITQSALEVVRKVGNRGFPLDQIRSVQAGTDLLGLPSIGLFRVNGIYGHWGTYYRPGVGIFRQYVTDTRAIVDITFANKKRLLISPDSPERFIAMLNEMGRVQDQTPFSNLSSP